MDSIKTTYATFPYEWTIKSTSCQIWYRKAFNISEIDEIFCSIINAKGNEIELSELGNLLGFNLQDLAEMDILNIYLKGLTEYNLISIENEIIQLTEFGQIALQSKLKYKNYFASTELFENQTATVENFDFSFKSVFDLENSLSISNKIDIEPSEDFEKKHKLQFQLFGNDIYKGEIIEFYDSKSYISYKNISLQCEITADGNSFQLSIFKAGINKPDLQFLIDLPENAELKSELLRKGMYHHILAENPSISTQDIETYKDLWNWKELAENPKVNWRDETIFKLFRENGGGGIWSVVSENATIESIKSVIQEYAEYWNWTTLTKRFDNDFIKDQIENFNWDFEELSYKEPEFVTSLLQNSTLKERDWDWNYLSKNLPDEFIEKHIEDFTWDFYVITENKNDVFKNTFIKYRDNLETLISKNWNWIFISEEININFLYKNKSGLASKLDWHTVLDRFFTNEDITEKCLKDESFKPILKQHLPENFVIAHQEYLWSLSLIDFFEQQNLIQWETKSYIKGFDTNENVEWNNPIFEKYQNRITTDNGFLNVSQRISDYTLIEQFPDFTWDWNGISKSKSLINNTKFVENAFVGNFDFSSNLNWNEILLQSDFNISFWNEYLEVFDEYIDRETQKEFWKSLTQREKTNFIFANSHLPWDWTYVTVNCTEENILESFGDEELFEKWDWKIATLKLDKETILDNLENLAHLIDWKTIINEVFKDEFVFENPKLKIAYRLSGLEPEKRKEIWKILTAKYPFPRIFQLVEKTFEFEIWEWDWDFISNHEHFPNDIPTLQKFRDKIIWAIFSESKAIQKKFKFTKEEWSYQEYIRYALRYLRQFKDYWDWNVLTKNSNLHYNRDLVRNFQDKWDWEYLSEFGGFIVKKKKDDDEYLSTLLTEFSLIHFNVLSKRKDIAIESSLIHSTKDTDWDWQVLSGNEKAEISNELILELKNKNWNWEALSKRKNIEFSNEILLQLVDKNWDWSYLSENENIEFNAEFIQQTKTKPWNWKAISRHKTFLPTIKLLTLTKDFELDWEYLSQHSSLNPTKELLAKFENKWHWQIITKNPQINFSDIDFIQRFADKWNWRFVCESGKLTLNKQILAQFKEYLDWNLISANTNLDFTKDIIQEFKQFWNWTALKKNKRVAELLSNYVADEINKSATLSFIDKMEQQWSGWKGSIYHFTHIDNAVEIIKNRKIQSRHKATIKGDAAGNVVHRRGDAHDYARFYFRPHTPTQFYNEFLGKNTTDGYENNKKLLFNSPQTGPIYEWVSWYDKARYLGFPKCPIPIFFKFSLKEVLFKNENKCCVSNGNMQKNATQFKPVELMLGKFNFQYLYSEIEDGLENYMNYSQQEFLVKDELSFKNGELNDFEIVCSSEADRTLLINLLGDEHKDIFSKIVVDISYYNNKNPRVRIEEEDSKLHIKSEFKGQGYFVLSVASNINDIEIIAGNVSKVDRDKIIFNSYVSLGNLKQNITLNFIDESGRNWFIYAR